jgi:hypothetical protein
MNNLIRMKDSLIKINSNENKPNEIFSKEMKMNKLNSNTNNTKQLKFKIKSYPSGNI